MRRFTFDQPTIRAKCPQCGNTVNFKVKQKNRSECPRCFGTVHTNAIEKEK